MSKHTFFYDILMIIILSAIAFIVLNTFVNSIGITQCRMVTADPRTGEPIEYEPGQYAVLLNGCFVHDSDGWNYSCWQYKLERVHRLKNATQTDLTNEVIE